MDEIQITEGGITLVTTNSKNYNSINNKLINEIVEEKGYYCVYLSLNKPASSIKKTLEKMTVSLEKIIFVDCVTKLTGGEVERSGNIIFVNSPQNLTQIGIVVEGAAISVEGKDTFLFLDSVSTLLLYSKAGTVTKFIHFLTALIRKLNMSGIILSLEENGENQNAISQITQFCDSRIDL